MMMTELRFVLDTNLIVSAALMERSFARRVFVFALHQGDVLISNETQGELTEVLMRSKFDRYVTEEKRLRFLANYLSIAVSVEITKRIDVCRDPKDNKFLELAFNGTADCIVTGDSDLLILHPFHDISILQPAEFMSQYE